MSEFSFKKTDKKIDLDSLKIDLNKKKIKAKLSVLKFIDRDTKQYVLFSPTLDISGYGSTFAKAEEIFTFNVRQFFEYLVNLSHSKIQEELSAIPFKK